MPEPRGPLSAGLLAALTRPAGSPLGDLRSAGTGDPVGDDDLQLALWIAYELHYRGFDDVDPEWEWDPRLLAVRAGWEARFLAGLREQVAVPAVVADVPQALTALVAADDGPPLSRYLQRQATLEQFREFAVQRSIYHLKEADPHSWGLPRLSGRPKAALVEIQADEYGGGRLARMHSELFRGVLVHLGLDTGYGAYLDEAAAPTLAVSNAMSLFGLHRRWLGALLGHLAAFEMTSSIPNRRYGTGLRRLGGDEAATRFYDEHVTADAVHEQIAVHDLCGAYAASNPESAGDILFGAASALHLDAAAGRWLLDRWQVPSVRDLDAGPKARPGRARGVEPHRLVGVVAEGLAS